MTETEIEKTTEFPLPPWALFRAGIRDLRLWKALVEILGTVGEEIIIRADARGLRATFFDHSRICLTHLELKPHFFTQYTCPASVTAKIPLDDLDRVLKRARVGSTKTPLDSIEIFINKSEPTTKRKTLLNRITCRSPKMVRDLEILLLDGDNDDWDSKIAVDELNLDFSAKVRFNPEALDIVCRDAELYSDDLAFTVTKDGLHLETDGDLGRFSCTLPTDENPIMELAEVKENKPIPVSKFSISYLKKLMKVHRWASVATFAMANQSPARFEIPIDAEGEDEEDAGCLVYFLAPKVEGDEFDEENCPPVAEDEFEDEFFE